MTRDGEALQKLTVSQHWFKSGGGGGNHWSGSVWSQKRASSDRD